MRDTSIRSLTIPRPVLALIAGIAAVLLAAVLALWIHYGTTVFYDSIIAGIGACL